MTSFMQFYCSLITDSCGFVITINTGKEAVSNLSELKLTKQGYIEGS